MNIEAIILVVHVLLALALLGLILIQHGKGADAGAAFGSGASGTVFGASGSGSFLTKITTWVAISFFATSLTLAYLSAHSGDKVSSVFDKTVEEQAADLPATAEEAVAENVPVAEDVPVVEEETTDLPAAE
jgi:preprotein translocase subunit SecG